MNKNIDLDLESESCCISSNEPRIYLLFIRVKERDRIFLLLILVKDIIILEL